MAVTTYRVTGWPGSPPTPISISQMTSDGDGGGSGHPHTIILIASNTVALPPNSEMWMTLLGSNAEGVDNNGFISVTAYLYDDDSPPEGIRFNNGAITCDGIGTNPASIFALEFVAQIGAPAGTLVDIVAQVGYFEDALPVDDPPTGGPDGIFPPVNLTATLVDDHVVLAWHDQADNELGFELEWSTVPAGVWQKFAVVPTDVTTHSDYDIEPGAEYSYRVRAFKADMASIYSNEATTAGQPLVLTPVTGPTGGGTAFTITGAFDPSGSTEVVFGDVPASDLEVFSSYLTGLTPAHAKGVVDVIVTRGATVDTLSEAFEFTSGGLVPRLVVSAPQFIAPPLPSSATLTAAVVDDNEGLFDEATFAWEFAAGPATGGAGFLIGSPESASTSVTATVYQAGVYYFRVTATGADIGGTPATLTAMGQVTLSMRAAPRVEGLTLTTNYPDSVIADPEVTDDGWSGDLSYAWTQVGGPDDATIVSPNTRSTEIQFPNLQGTYVFQLAVSNDELTGTGLIRVVNYAAVSPATTLADTLTITIDGVARS